MTNLLLILLLLVGCSEDENPVASGSNSITYNLVSVMGSDCVGADIVDYTDTFLNEVGGIFKIIINTDGSAIIRTSYSCGGIDYQHCADFPYDNQQECEENGCEWRGGDITTSWITENNENILNWAGTGQEQVSFVIFGTTMTINEQLDEGVCATYVLEED